MNITLALDWTPNTNHIGFYVALVSGWYAEAGLQVRITSTELDNYVLSPARKVAAGLATFGLCPSESIISFQTLPARPRLMAIAALLQHDTSAIVTVAGRGRDRPAQLDGCVYASYGSRFEAAIVAQMIRNDGGQGTFARVHPPKFDIWETLLRGEADAAWVFVPWEGQAALQRGVRLNTFFLDEYQIPYGYSPVITAHPHTLRRQPELVQAFLAISGRGFTYAAQHPHAAADLFCCAASSPHQTSRELLLLSLNRLQSNFLHSASGQWGRMEPQRWEVFLTWLITTGILNDLPQPLALKAHHLFSNRYLDSSLPA
ncbi:MAG: ABC transporter substrate-binding protein [Chloroflexaceae bacterium]|nr:ABC transporter substrate-binding protein [Chloroflexaceae bacterium]